jgi:Na+-transporting NADH:ubiquinone oxidoreductase subunit NqrC
MKVVWVLLMILVLCLYCSAVGASDVFEATPTEQEDVKTMDKGRSDVFEANSTEQSDMHSIDEINKGSSDVFEPTPIEQNDIKTIDQLNN